MHEGDELSEDVSILLVRSATSTGRVGKKAPTTAPSSAEGEAGNSRNTHLGRYSSVTPKQGFSGVMWMIMASKAESHLFVGYSDGVILLWDVAVAAVLMTMEADSFGASFSSMRRRIITSRNRAPPMTVYLEQQRKIQRQRSGEDELKSLKQIKIEIESRQNKPLAPGDITHFNYSFMSVCRCKCSMCLVKSRL